MQTRGTLMLLGASFFWGTTFVAQMSGMDNLGPFSYATARYFVGFFALLSVLIFTRRKQKISRRPTNSKSGIFVGLMIGVLLFFASSLQQISMLYTTAGKAAFITCLYIILVPLGSVLLGRVIRRENWLGAILALIGLYFLAVHENFSVQLGDLIVFASYKNERFEKIGKFAAKLDGMELSIGQICTSAILSFPVMMIFENPTLDAIFDAAIPILYAGIMSSGAAFTLQIYGQKYAEPAAAAILMSFEAIFGALASRLILGEIMTSREIFGCVLMIVGIIVTQWSVIQKSLKF